MEKALKYKHHFISGPRVILFKEDLEQLAELFKCNFGEIEIEADGYKVADISEINELEKDVIYDFMISGKDKDNYFDKMTLDISKKSTYIFIDGHNDTKCIGAKYKINEILRSRRRISNILIILKSYWGIIIPLSLFIILSSILIYYKSYFNKKYLEIYLSIILLLPFSLTLFLLFLSNFIYNSIHLKYSWEKINFYRRNKDKIIVGILCAIIGSITILVISFIINKINNAPNP